MGLWQLRVWTCHLVPAEQVWAYKHSPGSAADEVGPWLRFSVADAAAFERVVREGGAFSATFGLFGAGVPWTGAIAEVSPGVSFRDVADPNRLFAQWEHRHLVEPNANGARYVDEVRFAPAPRWERVESVFVRAVRQAFVRRHRRAARRLAADPRVTGVAVLRRYVADVAEEEPDLSD
jgi:ligand-binding SRPBCC domain-containing protein